MHSSKVDGFPMVNLVKLSKIDKKWTRLDFQNLLKFQKLTNSTYILSFAKKLENVHHGFVVLV